MKAVKGDKEFALPESVHSPSVFMYRRFPTHGVTVIRVTIGEILRSYGTSDINLMGTPRMFALSQEPEREAVIWWPACDEDMELIIRYCPAEKEI